MYIPKHLLVVVGTFVVLFYVPVYPRAEAMQSGCELISCPPGKFCLWNPILYSWCDASTPPTVGCYCGVQGNCTIEFEWVKSTGALINILDDDRPVGSCSQIPCGECYEICEENCWEVWKCLNPEQGYPCIRFPDNCRPTFLEFGILSSWQPTGEDCCIDIY